MVLQTYRVTVVSTCLSGNKESRELWTVIINLKQHAYETKAVVAELNRRTTAVKETLKAHLLPIMCIIRVSAAWRNLCPHLTGKNNFTHINN